MQALNRVIMHRLVLFVFCLMGVSACAPEGDINNQMIAAARMGDLEKVRHLIDKVDDIDARENVAGKGHTALFNAASAGHTDVVRFLIERGAKLNEQPGEVTPLIMAAWSGHQETVVVLLQAGSNPNAKDESGWSALTHAARKGYVDIARLLIEHGADVNVRLSDGNTPLSWAQAKKNQKMIDLLKSAGATENKENQRINGVTH